MAVNEPEGWSADCDYWPCNVTAEQDDHVDNEDDWLDTLRQWGWIEVDGDLFHSLDCLLLHRSNAKTRGYMSDRIAIHARIRHTGEVCCWRHGRHRADGVHDWSCPERRQAAQR